MNVVPVRHHDRYLCVACRQKRALYKGARGKLKCRKDHPLCQRCYQSELDRSRAATLLPRGARRRRLKRRAVRLRAVRNRHPESS